MTEPDIIDGIYKKTAKINRQKVGREPTKSIY